MLTIATRTTTRKSRGIYRATFATLYAAKKVGIGGVAASDGGTVRVGLEWKQSRTHAPAEDGMCAPYR